VDANAVFFFEDQFVEDGKNLFAIAVHAAQGIAEVVLVAVWVKPLVEQGTGDVNIAPERIGGVAAQKEAVKHCCFPLGSERVEIIATNHK
jgi:hypothetical protein